MVYKFFMDFVIHVKRQLAYSNNYKLVVPPVLQIFPGPAVAPSYTALKILLTSI